MTATVRHRHLDLDGVDVFYRASVPDDPDAPVLPLLHGFPSRPTSTAGSSTPSAPARGRLDDVTPLIAGFLAQL
jgi:hypothetical protein